MVNQKRLDLKPILPFLPSEPGLRAHLFRVSALAARAAQFNGYSEESVRDVGLAGFLHHHAMDDHATGDHATEGADRAVPTALLHDLGLEAVPGFAPLPAGGVAIVRAFRRADSNVDPAMAASAYLLESANLFDEQMENLPYEDSPTERAVAELLLSGMIAEPFLRALDSFRAVNRQELAGILMRMTPIALPTRGVEGTGEIEQAVRRSLEFGRDDSLWVHSLDIAKNVSQVAAESAKLDQQEAFVGGLVHDVGRLAYRASSAAAEVNHWQSLGFPVTYAEFLVSGADHAAIGAELLKMWGFPDSIVEAVEHHHRPELSLSALSAAIYAYEDFDELLPSCARDHLAAKRLDLSEVRHLGAAG